MLQAYVGAVANARVAVNVPRVWKRPLQAPGLVFLIERVLRIKVGILLIHSGVEIHAQRFCLAHHPAQRNVRESSFGISSADIAMDAGEVNLLNDLARSGRPRPQRSRKFATTFIN